MLIPIDPYFIGFCENSLRESEEYTRILLEQYHFKQREDKKDAVQKAIHVLVHKYPSHDFPLGYSELKDVLNVELISDRGKWKIVRDIHSYAKKLLDQYVNGLRGKLRDQFKPEEVESIMRVLSPLLLFTSQVVKFSVHTY